MTSLSIFPQWEDRGDDVSELLVTTRHETLQKAQPASRPELQRPRVSALQPSAQPRADLRRQIGYWGNKKQSYVVRESLLAFTVQTMRKHNL